MYEVLLMGHSYLRWLVLVLAAISLVSSLGGWLGGRPWRASDEARHRGFIMALDLQLLLGLGLYFVSPTVQAATADMAASMKDPVLRFWGVEHITTMLVAVVAAHVGRALSRRREGSDRNRPMAVGLLVFFLLVLAAFPWPDLPHGRPLLRGL